METTVNQDYLVFVKVETVENDEISENQRIFTTLEPNLVNSYVDKHNIGIKQEDYSSFIEAGKKENEVQPEYSGKYGWVKFDVGASYNDMDIKQENYSAFLVPEIESEDNIQPEYEVNLLEVPKNEEIEVKFEIDSESLVKEESFIETSNSSSHADEENLSISGAIFQSELFTYERQYNSHIVTHRSSSVVHPLAVQDIPFTPESPPRSPSPAPPKFIPWILHPIDFDNPHRSTRRRHTSFTSPYPMPVPAKATPPPSPRSPEPHTESSIPPGGSKRQPKYPHISPQLADRIAAELPTGQWSRALAEELRHYRPSYIPGNKKCRRSMRTSSGEAMWFQLPIYQPPKFIPWILHPIDFDNPHRSTRRRHESFTSPYPTPLPARATPPPSPRSPEPHTESSIPPDGSKRQPKYPHISPQLADRIAAELLTGQWSRALAEELRHYRPSYIPGNKKCRRSMRTSSGKAMWFQLPIYPD